MKWQISKVEIIKDSATVFSWLNSCVHSTHKIKTSGMYKMLIKRRQTIIKEICNAYSLEVKLVQVSSSDNKADGLTRVPKAWKI